MKDYKDRCNYTAHDNDEEYILLFIGGNISELIPLASEARDSTVLNYACSSTVSGKLWMEEL